MSDQENPNEDLKPIEAELAALVPRRDRFDPRWRAFLAKAADLNAGPTDEATAHAACSAPGDHLFLCVYCGASRPRISRVRRWTWPAAFSAMTAAAAVLLAMVAVRPEFQPVRNTAKTAEGDSPIFPAEKLGQSPRPADSPRQKYDSESSTGWASNTGPRWREQRLCRLAASDPQLFDQALLEYSHRQPTWGAMVAVNHFPRESVQTARDLMNEMLKRPN